MQDVLPDGGKQFWPPASEGNLTALQEPEHCPFLLRVLDRVKSTRWQSPISADDSKSGASAYNNTDVCLGTHACSPLQAECVASLLFVR